MIKKEYFKFFNDFRSFGNNGNTLYLFLYIITCYKEGIKIKLITDKLPVSDNNTLFGHKENILDLNYEKTRFELIDVPKEKKILLKINDVFNRIFNSQHSAKAITEYLHSNSIKHLKELLVGNSFEEIFEDFLKIIVSTQGKKSGEFVLPREIGEFMIKLANLEEEANIFNPFAGLATFGINLTEDQKYFGHEINELIWAVAVLRLNAHNKLTNSDFLKVDSFCNWPSSRKFDLVIANAPFRLRLTKEQQSVFNKISYVEGFFLKEGVNLLESNGKLLSIVPQGFLTDRSEKELRQFLVDQDLLEAVISFPGGLLMNTNIPFVILLINKNKKHPKEIAFFKSSKYVTEVSGFGKILESNGLLDEVKKVLAGQDGLVNESQEAYGVDDSLLPELVNKHKIIENDYYLNINRYSLDKIKGTPLKNVVTLEQPISFRNVSETLDTPEKVGNSQNPSIKHISTKDLKKDSKHFTIDPSTLERRKVKQGKFVDKSTYLVSLIGNNLKPSFLPVENEVIHLSTDIVPFTINEDLVDADWLVKELNSTKVKEQQEALVFGVIPRIRKKDFLNIKIHLPSLKEQKEEMKRILGLERKVDDLESDIIQQNSYLRHTVAGPLSDLEYALKNIDTIIQSIAEQQMPQILDSKVSDNHLYTLGEHLQDSKKYVSFILDTVSSKLNSSQKIVQKKLEKLNLRKYIENYVKRKTETIKSEDYSIEFDFDRDFFNNKANAQFDYILGNKELINTLLDNMIDNAVKHAFADSKSNKIEIYVWGYDEEAGKENIYFSVSNTGKPLDENITLDTLKKSGYSKGSKKGDGFGLWLVNEILRKHDADWYMVDEFRVYNSSKNKTTSIKGFDIPILTSDIVTKFSFNFPILKV